jgi:hypothetical protein
MRKELTEKQLLKGQRQMSHAKEYIQSRMNNIVEFKGFCKGKYFIGGTDVTTLKAMQAELIEAREHYAKLERIYK